MNTQRWAAFLVFFSIALLLGSASAEWMVSGGCNPGSNVIPAVVVLNGNCMPLDRSWVQITTNTSSNSILISYCSDKNCQKCDQFYDWPIVEFVDCSKTPTFKYSTKTNPVEDVIANFGGMVYGIGDTFDNCTTSPAINFYPANVCVPYPPLGQSSMMRCSPDSEFMTNTYYSDMNCKHEIETVASRLENNCYNPNDTVQKRMMDRKYSFCAFQ
jgi:hypothetical protein